MFRPGLEVVPLTAGFTAPRPADVLVADTVLLLTGTAPFEPQTQRRRCPDFLHIHHRLSLEMTDTLFTKEPNNNIMALIDKIAN